MFPDHESYCEVFGGAAGVLLRKPRSKTEIYNDLDSQVVTFFKLLRDSVSLAALVRAVDLTPFSREEFELSFEPVDCPIEATRRFLVRCTFGHGTATINPNDSNGFRSGDLKAGKSYAREWAGIPQAIVRAADRFQGVTIEHQDFRRLIPRYDSPTTLFYVDPPYPLSTRASGGKGYVHELSDWDHRQLAWLLKTARGKVAISGYPSGLYDELFGQWRRVEKSATASGQLGAVQRTEVLWMNY